MLAASKATHLHILENREHKKVQFRVAPPDYDPRRRRSREIIWPKHPQQSIAHEHVVILHSTLKKSLDGAIVLVLKRRDFRGVDASDRIRILFQPSAKVTSN